MKGFMKRDFYLMVPNLKFFGVVLGVFALLVVFTDFQVTFLALYATIFCMSAFVGLFNYDEVNHWQAYAAATPNGRREQVDGRYALALLMCGGYNVLLLDEPTNHLDLPARESLEAALREYEGTLLFELCLIYGGGALLYIDVLMPVSYRFGGNKSRTVILVIVVACSAAIGAGGAIVGMSSYGSGGFSLRWLVLPVLGVGLLGMWVSRMISIKVMEHKEL